MFISLCTICWNLLYQVKLMRDSLHFRWDLLIFVCCLFQHLMTTVNPWFAYIVTPWIPHMPNPTQTTWKYSRENTMYSLSLHYLINSSSPELLDSFSFSHDKTLRSFQRLVFFFHWRYLLIHSWVLTYSWNFLYEGS